MSSVDFRCFGADPTDESCEIEELRSLAIASAMASTHNVAILLLGAYRTNEWPLAAIGTVINSNALFCRWFVLRTIVSDVNDTIWKISTSGDLPKRKESADGSYTSK